MTCAQVVLPRNSPNQAIVSGKASNSSAPARWCPYLQRGSAADSPGDLHEPLSVPPPQRVILLKHHPRSAEIMGVGHHGLRARSPCVEFAAITVAHVKITRLDRAAGDRVSDQPLAGLTPSSSERAADPATPAIAPTAGRQAAPPRRPSDGCGAWVHRRKDVNSPVRGPAQFRHPAMQRGPTGAGDLGHRRGVDRVIGRGCPMRGWSVTGQRWRRPG